jgi:hypothetical protein
MAEYLIHDRDKAAFINRMNKLLKQVKPGFELDSTNFIDVPGNGEDDMSIFVTNNPIEISLLDMLISKRKFSYSIKKVNLKEIVSASRA